MPFTSPMRRLGHFNAGRGRFLQFEETGRQRIKFLLQLVDQLPLLFNGARKLINGLALVGDRDFQIDDLRVRKHRHGGNLQRLSWSFPDRTGNTVAPPFCRASLIYDCNFDCPVKNYLTGTQFADSLVCGNERLGGNDRRAEAGK